MHVELQQALARTLARRYANQFQKFRNQHFELLRQQIRRLRFGDQTRDIFTLGQPYAGPTVPLGLA